MKLTNFLGFVLGSLFNVLLGMVTIILVYNFTVLSYNMSKDYMSKDDSNIEVSVTIPDDASLKEVSQVLHEKGLVKSALIFRLENMIGDSKLKFRGGTYFLNTSMNNDKMIDILKKPEAAATDIKATIREGLNLKEIGEYLESLEIVKAEDFLKACEEEYNYDFLVPIKDREKKLEGYLFPDTYFFVKNMPPRQVINKMLVRFEEIYSYEYIARTKELELSIDDVIKMASIIEKEVSRKDEKSKLSSLIYNRLKADMKLEMTSTIIYVVEKRKDSLVDSDFKVKSSYNTYVNMGLPSSPISNPGEASIIAVLYPEETNYVFFELKDEKTDEHVFLDKAN